MEHVPEWFRDAILGIFLSLLLLLLIKATFKILGSELHHFLDAVKSEMIDAIRRVNTVGALNLYGILIVSIVGVVVIIATGTQKAFGILLLFLSRKQAEEFSSYTNYFSLFYVVALLFIVSIVCVVIDNRRPR
jgi:hypothetical protein